MKYVGLPPGNILQNIFIEKQLKRLKKEGLSTFLEIGSGNGHNSNLFLTNGFKGEGYDLNERACKNNSEQNKTYIKNNQYKVNHGNFFDIETSQKYDIIISCMVIEHLEDELVGKYFEKAKKLLNENGRIICLVPSSMKHWGIEDDIAGHIKRYENKDLISIENKHNLKLEKQAGLTYPISNFLLKLSNKVIAKNESEMMDKTLQERTVYTGDRNVQYKTSFPKVFNIILNSWSMYPLHLIQMVFKNNKNALVLYFELKK